MLRSSLVCALCAVMLTGSGLAVHSQVRFESPSPLVWPRSLALSPDGKQIAFTYRGDIWVASSTGGAAHPVTNHVEMDDNPVWSPDGKYIAFASNRTGNWDIFVVPSDGGQSQRLTYFSGSDVPKDWTSDGWILTGGRREEGYAGLFGVQVSSGRVKRFLLDNFNVANPMIAPDGKTLMYTRMGFPEGRERYEGTAAQQIQLFDLGSNKRTPLHNTRFQQLWPRPMPDGTFVAVTVGEKTPSSSPLGHPIPKVVDSSARTPNVYRFARNGSVDRLTSFVGAAVRYLTVAKSTGLMAFERDGIAYTLAPGAKEPTRINFTASIDDKTTKEERLVLTDGVRNASLSPKGDTWVFSTRGDIFSVPVKQGKGPNSSDARQLTSWAGQDIGPIWHPSENVFYYLSDQQGALCLYSMNLDSMKSTLLSPPNADVDDLELTPDRKSLTFVISNSKDAGIYKLDFGAVKPTLIMSGRNLGPYSFSPDMKWIAFQKTYSDVSDIFLYEIATGKSTNVTKRNVLNTNPSWSADGKYLYLRSSRAGDGIYILPLQPEDAKPEDIELKFAKPAGPVSVSIDLDQIHLRLRRIIGQGNDSTIYSDPENGNLTYLSGGDLWTAAYDGSSLRRLTGGGGVSSYDVSADGKTISFVMGGQMYWWSWKTPNAQPQMTPFRSDWIHDLRAEHQAAFMEFYRIYNGRFYDPNFHGRDWTQIRDRYMPLLDSVEHRNEMATLLNFMVGELESSHSEVNPAPGNPGSATSAHPGFAFDTNYEGPGLKISDVPERSPGSFAKTKLGVGEVVLEINGQAVKADEALYRDVLNQQNGRDLVMLVSKDGSRTNTRTVSYRAMSQGEYSGLLFQNLLNWRRTYVEQKSGGLLAYVHIAGMGEGNYVAFNEEAYEAIQGRKGMIVDVRNNGGGNISDRLIDEIERVPHSWYVPRDGEPETAPTFSWSVPTVVMMAESSFSNAEMFPSSMKARRLAKLVGMQTPGYVIWTFGGRIVDGTSIRIPFGGSYRLDGTPLEDNGEVPDFTVDITPEEFFAGKDPQLDKAIQVALDEVRKSGR